MTNAFPNAADYYYDSPRVWRYMSFGRFVWMLQKKQLWLSRVDLLDDPWELALAGDQLAHVVAQHPLTPLDEPPRENAMARSARIIKQWRRRTFVNCWTADENESHALWRIYCRSIEGVAIKTTLSRLKASVGDLPVHGVTYCEPGFRKQTPDLMQLVTEKRPMFAYENEVRVIKTLVEPRGRRRSEAREIDQEPDETTGRALDWNPESVLESIYVHPEADHPFMEVVTGVVEQYAPALKEQVFWSAMQAQPPF